jgi:hypothetical protein
MPVLVEAVIGSIMAATTAKVNPAALRHEK